LYWRLEKRSGDPSGAQQESTWPGAESSPEISEEKDRKAINRPRNTSNGHALFPAKTGPWGGQPSCKAGGGSGCRRRRIGSLSR